MLGIDPSIVEHEIKTYQNVKPVRQKLQPINPKTIAAIKEEVENILKHGFIYLVPLTEWVFNHVSIIKNKEQSEYILNLGI